MHMEIQQLKEMGFNKSQIARRLNISRPTLNKYYDLSIKEFKEVLETINTRLYEAVEDPPMGQQMQVDMGEKRVYKVDKINRFKLYLIAFVFSHSQYRYVEWR